MRDWSPESWKRKPAAQQPAYESEAEVAKVVEQISHLPPLVTSWEIEALKSQLAEASRGERFLLQGGDCAETFDNCDSNTIANKLKILLQMSLVLIHASKKPVVRVVTGLIKSLRYLYPVPPTFVAGVTTVHDLFAYLAVAMLVLHLLAARSAARSWPGGWIG